MPIDNWGTDTTVSLPSVPSEDYPMLVDLGGSGFGFTAGGICHNVTQADIEELATPPMAPPIDLTTIN